MVEPILIFHTIIFLIMLRYTIKAINRISKGQDSLANFTLLFIMFFNGIPLILDVVFGFPNYGFSYIGFNKAMNHIPSSIIYNFYLIIIFYILNRYSKINSYKESINIPSVNYHTAKNLYTKNDMLKELLMIFIIILPLLHVIISPYFNHFIIYGSPGMRGITDGSFNELNSMLRMLSLAFLSIWLLGKKKQGGFFEILLFSLFSLMLIWIDGKRYIIAFILVIIFYTLWKRGKIRGKKFVVYLSMGLIALIALSVYYQIIMRSSFVNYSEFDSLYRGYRLDFSRDSVVKLAIYSEISDFPKILDYRGQSFLALVLMYVPRAIWSNKPYQYTKYITASIFQVQPENVTYGITYSIFDQSIANFGLYLGLPFAILFLLKLIQVGDKSKSNTTKLLLLLIIISSLTMNLAYIAPIIIVLIGRIGIAKLMKHGKKNKILSQ